MYNTTRRYTFDMADDNVFLVSDFDFDHFKDESPHDSEARQRSRPSRSATRSDISSVRFSESV